MNGASTEARFGLRWGLFALATAIAVIAIGSDPADARGRRKRHAYQPPYAAIVVDANSGRVLHAKNADSLRHPASITKIMTLYLLFERLEAGKLKLDTELPVSAHAAAQAPSKLGLRPGETIEVEDAIKALVTKSANDVAVVVAEAIGGTEREFARMMTRKARALGMEKTVYVNASGLPDEDQVTTAREQAILGRAIQERFPQYYRYFSTRVFTYHGRHMRNHNHLLGRVDGVDGIKTGYIRASGFNLVASLRRDGRHLIAVVIGGSSARSRDARMRDLLESNVEIASVRRTAPPVAEIAPQRPPRREREEPVAVASADPVADAGADVSSRGVDLPPPVARPRGKARVQAGSAEPIKPILVRTIAVKRNPRGAKVAEFAEREEQGAPEHTSATRGGWMIQVGAFPDESVARDRLKEVQSVAKSILASAEPFTMPVVKRDTTLYRARFAGLDRESAEAACKYLKRNDIACLALKD
ncbi:MAG TPA: D-alanyl-D-alanine carboxypeptidase [Xanthobacteraceae bacterium]|nr:D-alanyl-D-alanine carboxypeptidase [Xanthobacteraceae bacterium]